VKLIDKEHKHSAFDVASGLAEALLKTGTVEVYKEPTFNVQHSLVGDHTTEFQCREGDIVEDFQNPPFIFYACRSCGQGRITGPTAHNSKVFNQPPKGFAQSIPGDVAIAFISMRKAYDKRGKRGKRS
jgi:hypothetical protein